MEKKEKIKKLISEKEVVIGISLNNNKPVTEEDVKKSKEEYLKKLDEISLKAKEKKKKKK